MNIEQLITTGESHRRNEFPWGEIVWIDGEELTGTDTLTVGQVTFHPGAENREHYHPNCDESLYLLSGTLKHTLGDEAATLEAGDLIHIPSGEPHQGINVGDEDAVAVIVYDTGSREVIFADEDTNAE